MDDQQAQQEDNKLIMDLAWQQQQKKVSIVVHRYQRNCPDICGLEIVSEIRPGLPSD